MSRRRLSPGMRFGLPVVLVALALSASSSMRLPAETQANEVAAADADPFDAMLRDNFAFAGQQLSAMTGTIPTDRYPHYTHRETEVWVTTVASGWPSGFFPGALWLMYQQTAHPTWRSHAQTWQAGIESQKTKTSIHDLGFMLFNSFGNGYRLTGNDAYRQVVLTAAGLARQALLRASRLHQIRGSQTACDGPDFKVIIDNMMNLELLFWASRNGGDPEWYDMAVSHALRTAKEHVRSDGSTYQIVDFAPSTGAVQSRCNHQGYSCESTWSRGQAWALYGFTMTYRYTRDVRFLNTARATADYFIANLPGDDVPYWDFEAPGIPSEPRDSSAAAIAASGLLELSQLDTDATRRQGYLKPPSRS